MQRFSTREPIGLHSLGVLQQEDEPQNIWLWRPAGLTFRRARGMWGTDSTLKGGTQSLSCSMTKSRSSDLKEAWVRPTCWTWRAPQTGRKQLELTVGHRHWQQLFWGFVAPQGHWCWQAPFWDPPSSLSARTQPHQPVHY